MCGPILFLGDAMTLSEARFHRKVTQLILGLQVGISQTRISLIERGFVNPREREKRKIAQALGLKPEQLQWGNCERR
jgi:transcriptional regulator with XRE-family HTH domain